MSPSMITKGSTVEVSSDEPGFHGAWYLATILDQIITPTKNIKKSSQKKPKKLNKTGYLIKYHTLLKEDSDEPLTEVVDSSFIRPLPPVNVLRNNEVNVKEVVNGDGDGDGEEFEVYDVVDAYYREGWWLGVVKTVILNAEGEIWKYVVAFEDPYEEVEFDQSKMRFHVDWVEQRWMIPPKKTPDEGLGDRNASDDALSGFTTPSNGTVVTALPAKKNRRSRTRSGIHSDVDIPVTYSRSKRIVNSAEDGSRGKRSKSSTGGKGSTKAIVPVLETSGTDDIHQDSPPVEHAINVTQTHEAEDGESKQKRKRGTKPNSAVEKPIGLLEDGQEEFTDIDEAPLSVWFKGMRSFSVLKKSSCFSPPDNSLNQAVVANGAVSETTTTDDYRQNWPFIKRAPIWDAIESLELYQKPPQKPHFSPLKNMKMDYREGIAIALMVTYGNLVQGLSDLQPNDPVDVINANLETLSELESHGFDVDLIKGRFKELLSLKSKVGPHKDRRKEVEDELEKCIREKSVVEKELDRLKAEMQALEEKTLQAAAMKKAKEEEIVRLEKNLDLVSKEINDWDAAFEKLCKKVLTLA